jgi:SAM-dependent methyltransferase
MARSGWRNWLRNESAQKLSTDEAYALWAATYPPRAHNVLMEVEQASVEPIVSCLIAERALDVGTGTGRNLALLKAQGIPHLVGIDRSPAMLNRCDPAHARVCADAARLPFVAHSFDLVCSSLMLGDVRDLSSWLSEAARVLTPGGHLVYSDFHPSWSMRKWKRTFRTEDGREFELGYFAHTMDDHLTALERHGFRIRVIREPRADGRPDPVVVVFHAVRPGLSLATRRNRRDMHAVAPGSVETVRCRE